MYLIQFISHLLYSFMVYQSKSLWNKIKYLYQERKVFFINSANIILVIKLNKNKINGNIERKYLGYFKGIFKCDKNIKFPCHSTSKTIFLR